MRYAVCLLMLLCAPLQAGQPCHAQQVQVQTVQQVAIPVAAVPLTVGYAVDLQSYQYRVNPSSFSFNTYSNYLNQAYQSSGNMQAQTVPKTSTNTASSGTIQLDDETKNAIARELLRLMQEQGVVQIDNTDEPVSSAPPKTTPPAPQPAAEDNAAAILDSAKALLATRCARCHTLDSDPKGQLALFDSRGNLLSGLRRDLILSRINSGDPEVRMPPPPAKALDQNEVAILKAWAELKSRK